MLPKSNDLSYISHIDVYCMSPLPLPSDYTVRFEYGKSLVRFQVGSFIETLRFVFLPLMTLYK